MQSTEKKFVPPVKIVAMKNIYKKKYEISTLNFTYMRYLRKGDDGRVASKNFYSLHYCCLRLIG